MSKTLTEMAAEILAARVRHEAMTSKQIESCLNDTFEALQKLKEKEDALLGNAVETPEQPAQTKAEPKENTVEEPTDKPEQTPLKPEPDESPVETPIETLTEEPEQQESAVEEPIEKSEEPSTPAVQPKDTMASTILSLIKSKPKGVDTKYIMEQTGYKKNQVWATVNSAKKKGQIKTTKRGIYVSAKAPKGK
jgi:outer membrane biosynthesis protein TonB